MQKPFLIEEQQWYYLTHSWVDESIHTFSKDITLKVNIIAQQEFELLHYYITVYHMIHYATWTPPAYIFCVTV